MAFAGSAGAGFIYLTWTPGADTYQIWRSDTNDRSAAVLLADALTASPFQDWIVVNGQTYYYWLYDVTSAVWDPVSSTGGVSVTATWKDISTSSTRSNFL